MKNAYGNIEFFQTSRFDGNPLSMQHCLYKMKKQCFDVTRNIIATGNARVESEKKEKLRGHLTPRWHYKQSEVACKDMYVFFRNIYIIAGQVRGSDLSRPDPPLAVSVVTLSIWP